MKKFDGLWYLHGRNIKAFSTKGNPLLHELFITTLKKGEVSGFHECFRFSLNADRKDVKVQEYFNTLYKGDFDRLSLIILFDYMVYKQRRSYKDGKLKVIDQGLIYTINKKGEQTLRIKAKNRVEIEHLQYLDSIWENIGDLTITTDVTTGEVEFDYGDDLSEY